MSGLSKHTRWAGESGLVPSSPRSCLSLRPARASPEHRTTAFGGGTGQDRVLNWNRFPGELSLRCSPQIRPHTLPWGWRFVTQMPLCGDGRDGVAGSPRGTGLPFVVLEQELHFWRL